MFAVADITMQVVSTTVSLRPKSNDCHQSYKEDQALPRVRTRST